MVDGGKIQPGNGDVHLMVPNGNTKDIISVILAADSLGVDYVREFAKDLQGEDVLQTCYNIYNFLHTQIPFIEDPDGQQFVVLPGRAYENRKQEFGGNGYGIDCKSFSLFASCILRSLGNYNFKYRFVSQSKNDELHHVYLIVYYDGAYIPLDCTLNEFCVELPFEKHVDIAPEHDSAAKIGATQPRKIYVGAPGLTIENNWVQIESDYAYNIKTIRQTAINHFYDGLMLEHQNHPLKQNIITSKVGKNLDLFETVGYCCMYKFWDRTKAPFPTDTTALTSMFPGLAEKMEFSEGLYDSFIKLGARHGDIMALASVSCFKQYGISLDYMLYRCYNTVNYGTFWTPRPGVPYLDMNTMQWKMNGGTTDDILKISFCFPFGNGHYVGMSRPYGQPYWCNGGWIMQNGVGINPGGRLDLNKWIAENPMPDGLLTRTPTEELISEATGLYYTWLNGNMPAMPTTIDNRPGATINTNSISNRPGVGDGGISAVVATVVAIVSAVATIAAMVAKIVMEFKKPRGESSIPLPQKDFKWEYRSKDGGYIFRNAQGGYDKCDANGQNCQTNINMNDPNNQPGSTNFFDGNNAIQYAGYGLLGLGAYMYLTDSKN